MLPRAPLASLAALLAIAPALAAGVPLVDAPEVGDLGGVESWLDQAWLGGDPALRAAEAANLAAAGALLPHADGLSGFADVVAAALEANAQQARLLGLASPQPTLPRGDAGPAAAVVALAAQRGLALSAEQRAEVAALDALPPAKAAALAGFVEAFLAFDAAADGAYADADLDALLQPSDLGGLVGARAVAQHLANAGLAPQGLFDARAGLLLATLAVQAAWAAPATEGGEHQSYFLHPLLGLDLTGVANVWEDDYVLLLDVGGDDIYHNNAGGSRVEASREGSAAAAVDLGGDDVYRGWSIVNGAGYNGAGFLFDAAGDDRYTPRSNPANGAGNMAGLGFLVDAAGDDAYLRAEPWFQGSYAFNGGGQLGVGFLLDRAGNDTYYAGQIAVNGGSADGVGFLVDLGGNDLYRSVGGRLDQLEALGANGGAAGGFVGSSGFLLDAGGHDVYEAGDEGSNGGANGFLGSGVGFLLDREGDDRYTGGSYGTNGGAGGGLTNGAGLLVDLRGDDAYVAGDFGTNGGALQVGLGALVDLRGDDRYTAGRGAVNGGAQTTGLGLLLDGSGRDEYAEASGSCRDCSYLGKVFSGFQVDLVSWMPIGIGI